MGRFKIFAQMVGPNISSFNLQRSAIGNCSGLVQDKCFETGEGALPKKEIISMYSSLAECRLIYGVVKSRFVSR